MDEVKIFVNYAHVDSKEKDRLKQQYEEHI